MYTLKIIRKLFEIALKILPMLPLISCHKEAVRDPYIGESIVLLNNDSIKLETSVTLFDNIFSFDMAYLEGKIPRMAIEIYNIPKLVNSYAIHPSVAQSNSTPSAILYTTIEDYAQDEYVLIDTDTMKNIFRVEYIDDKYVRGSYTLYFARFPLVQKKDVFPDTIYLTHGKIYNKYLKK